MIKCMKMVRFDEKISHLSTEPKSTFVGIKEKD